MAAGDLFKRTLDAGSSLVGMTRERAEAVVKEWVDAGDVRKARAQKAIDDLLDRSRKATDDIREMVRREIREQVSTLGFATKDDLADLEARLGVAPTRVSTGRGRGGKAAPIKKAFVKKAPAEKGAVKKVPVKKAPVTKAPVTKAPVTKAPVKKAPVKKGPVTKAAVKKAPVKKAVARRAAPTGAREA